MEKKRSDSRSRQNGVTESDRMGSFWVIRRLGTSRSWRKIIQIRCYWNASSIVEVSGRWCCCEWVLFADIFCVVADLAFDRRTHKKLFTGEIEFERFYRYLRCALQNTFMHLVALMASSDSDGFTENPTVDGQSHLSPSRQPSKQRSFQHTLKVPSV